MPKVSVIVPVYNVEKYLRQCIECLLNQTLKEIEIILVNDGSTDNSLLICQEYAAKDKRVKLVSKENGGQSSARNYGLEFVNSEYVGFVDSDDWVSPNFYETLYEAITKNRCDIAATSAIRKYNYRQTYRYHYSEEFVANTLEEKIKTANIPKCCYIWNKLYKTELVKENLFKEQVFYEDVLWLPNIIKRADKVVFTPGGMYYYRANFNSTVKAKQTPKKQLDYFNAQKELIHFFEENGLKLTEKQKIITKEKKYIGNLLMIKIKEFGYTKFYYLFGFILLCKITKYPKVEVFHG